MRQIISFDRVKLTNNEMDDKGQVSVCNHLLQEKERDTKASVRRSSWRCQGGFLQMS